MTALLIIGFVISTAALMALGAALSLASDPYSDGAEWAGALAGVCLSAFLWFGIITPYFVS